MSKNTAVPDNSASRKGITGNQGVGFDLKRIKGFELPDGKILEEKALALASLKMPRGTRKIAPLAKVMRAIDLTTLSGDDTVARIRRLCRLARSPLPSSTKKAVGLGPTEARVAAVCVYPAFVPSALAALDGTGIPVATVSAGFPHGLSSLSQRVREVADAAEAGADEIDIVIRREWPITGAWEELYDEVRAFKEASGDTHLKVILGTGELEIPSRVARAALTAMMAGADFVKTSTGKEKVNATLPVGLAMAAAIRRYKDWTGCMIGLKPAGGISTALDGIKWLRLAEEELGPEWTEPTLFRIGASSLLGDVVEALRAATGK